MSEQTMNEMPEMTLDNIEDMPGFDLPPSGEYLCALSLQYKVLNAKPKLEFQFEIKEIINKGDQHPEAPAMPGQKFGVLTNYDETGLKFAKKHLAMCQAAIGCGPSLSEIIGGTKDLPVKVTFNYRTQDKIDPNTNKPYENLQIKAMAVA